MLLCKSHFIVPADWALLLPYLTVLPILPHQARPPFTMPSLALCYQPTPPHPPHSTVCTSPVQPSQLCPTPPNHTKQAPVANPCLHPVSCQATSFTSPPPPPTFLHHTMLYPITSHPAPPHLVLSHQILPSSTQPHPGVPLGKIHLLARRASCFRNLLARDWFHSPTEPVNYKIHSPKLIIIIIKLVHLTSQSQSQTHPGAARVSHNTTWSYTTEWLTAQDGSSSQAKL